MTKVIKSDGRREAFSTRKLRRSITSAAKEAEVPTKRAREVVSKVSRAAIAMARKRKEIRTRDLRTRILKELDATEPAVSRAWRSYDQRK